MKRTVVFSLLTLSLALAIGTTGCRKNQVGTTKIPGRDGGDAAGQLGTGPGGGLGTGGTFDPNSATARDIPLEGAPASGSAMNTGPQDREALKAQTVQFDLDSATIKKSEKPKLDKVAAYLKANPTHDLLIEGHCDERGTEGYNLSLGERRAMAAREYLISVGADGNNIYTISYGETRPIEPLHSDDAYSKNRRDEFVVALPAQ